MKNINEKTAPDQMRVFMKRIRENNSNDKKSKEKPEKDLTMRDMLKITRKLNEQTKVSGKETVFDQANEEQKFRNYFDDMNVNIKFIDMHVENNLVFWGGTIDGIIQFVYKVTPDENTSGVEFNYLDNFSPDNPENDEIIKRVEGYYNLFYKYWRNNMLEK